MKSDLLRAIFFLVLVVLFFMLPQSVTDKIRLKVYGVFSRTDSAVRDIDEQQSAYDSSVAPQQRVLELTNELMIKDAQILSLKREMRNLIELRNIFPLTKITPAKVLGYRPGTSASEVYLSVGISSGVSKGDTVVQAGAYAGRIFMADDSASMAILVDNPGCVVAGRAARSGDVCIVRGEGYNKARAVFYVSQSAVMPGEKIITSGLLGKTPEGLVIATVEDYPVRGREPGTMEAPVKIQARLSSLEDVVIIGVEKPDKQEQMPGGS